MNGRRERDGLPLAGVRVVDFSWAVAGPVTTKLLALFGAEVIKIESRVRIDGGRLGTPFLEGRPGINKSGYFANHNTSKRSIRLDLSKPEAKEIVRRLAAVADVVARELLRGRDRAPRPRLRGALQGQGRPRDDQPDDARGRPAPSPATSASGAPSRALPASTTSPAGLRATPPGPTSPTPTSSCPGSLPPRSSPRSAAATAPAKGPVSRPLPTGSGAPLPRAVAARLHRQRQRAGARRQPRPRRGAARRLPLRRR